MKYMFWSRMNLQAGKLLVAVGLITAAHGLSATTLVVGSCKGGGGYTTIQAAINAAPTAATVQVCPGTYYEQVEITHGLTLEGISSNGTDLAAIAAPANGLTQTAPTDINGYTVAYQVWVNNSTGPVNISNILLNGSGNLLSSCPPAIAGIYYQNSPGTINGVSATDEYGTGCGVGIWVEGGSTNPSVTVENSVVINFDYLGIFAETSNGNFNSQLTAKITSNNVLNNSTLSFYAGIMVVYGTTSTVTKNLVEMHGTEGAQGNAGIYIASAAVGSVTSNTVMGYINGILDYANDVPVTSNTLVGDGTGINVQTAAAAIKQNSIVGGTGIEFNCIANPNVLSNIVNFASTGLDRVPSALGTSTNKVFNTTTVRTGGC